MQAPRERLPGLVDKARAFVEEAAPITVHHDAIGVEQHDRRLVLRARIDRLDVHAVRLAGQVGAERLRHADAVAGVEMRARREQRDRVAAVAEVLAHHRSIGLEAAAGEHHSIGGQRLPGGEADAGDGVILSGQRVDGTTEAEHNAGLARGTGELAVDGLTAANGLDARRTFRQIINRLVERHAVAGDPLHRGGRVLRQRRKVAFVALELRRLQHVVNE